MKTTRNRIVLELATALILLGARFAASSRSLRLLYGLSALIQIMPGSSTWLIKGTKASALNAALRSGSSMTVLSAGKLMKPM